MDLSDDLLEYIKKEDLKVTWTHQDEEIKRIIMKGKAFIQLRCGTLPFSLSDESDLAYSARSLLGDYCRYRWNSYSSSFEQDFRSEILNLQLSAAVERRKQNAQKKNQNI